MLITLQDFLADATPKAAADLAEALGRIPENKRAWSTGGNARTALDQVAECALLTGYTAELIQTRTWSTRNFDEYVPRKEALIASGWDALRTRLQENAHLAATAIRAVPTEALSEEIEMPFGKQTVVLILAYPYWNMTYHLGQINGIASLLGVSL